MTRGVLEHGRPRIDRAHHPAIDALALARALRQMGIGVEDDHDPVLRPDEHAHELEAGRIRDDADARRGLGGESRSAPNPEIPPAAAASLSFLADTAARRARTFSTGTGIGLSTGTSTCPRRRAAAGAPAGPRQTGKEKRIRARARPARDVRTRLPRSFGKAERRAFGGNDAGGRREEGGRARAFRKAAQGGDAKSRRGRKHGNTAVKRGNTGGIGDWG